MEQIIKSYGKILLDMLVLGCLLSVLFGGLTDDAGNEGILHIIGAHFAAEEQEVERTDLQVYVTEGKIPPPRIFYAGESAILTGRRRLAEYIKATDAEGKNLQIQLLAVLDESGRQIENCNFETTGVEFQMPGIYTVQIAAVDERRKKNVCQIRLPVSKQEE